MYRLVSQEKLVETENFHRKSGLSCRYVEFYVASVVADFHLIHNYWKARQQGLSKYQDLSLGRRRQQVTTHFHSLQG